MMLYPRLNHQFVEHIPEKLEPGVLYISMDFGSAAHLCCCGCGEEVVTPITPTDWKLTYDGETISLWPSIGSWTLDCRSHYIIERSRIRECGQWSEQQVEGELLRDMAAKERHYGVKVETLSPVPTIPQPSIKTGLRQRLCRWIFGE